MALKLAIGNVIGVRVEGAWRDESGTDKPFKFVLSCDRLSTEQLETEGADKGQTILTFFETHAKGWKDQNLVLEEDGTPAAFSVDALRALIGMSGMPMLLWKSYLNQVAVTAKN
jgi:hypothetical protein